MTYEDRARGIVSYVCATGPNQASMDHVLCVLREVERETVERCIRQVASKAAAFRELARHGYVNGDHSDAGHYALAALRALLPDDTGTDDG